jgi:hypothetical protein
LTAALGREIGIGAIVGLKDPLIFLLTNQFVSHPQSEIEQGSSLPRLSLRSDSRAAGSSMIGPNKSWQTTAK